MGGLERRRAKRVAREVEVWRYGRPWAELVSVVSARQRGWQRKRGKRHNLVNEGSGDYALRVASNREETVIRVRPRRRRRAVKSRAGTLGRSEWHWPGWLLETGKTRRPFIRSSNTVTPQVSLDRS